MRRLILAALAFQCSYLFAQTPVRMEIVGQDRRFVFAKWLVGGKSAFNDVEKQMFLGQDPNAAVQALTPDNYELTLSSSGISFGNLSDFIRARDDKEALRDKLDDMPPSDARKQAASITFLREEIKKR